jgi:2-aminoethylphosphonate-pyruvate transaminase
MIQNPPSLPPSKDPLLFTPGPLTTSRTVKQAMLRDMGSRDFEFIDLVRDIRRRLLAIGGAEDGYAAVLLPGSGTYALEAVVSSTVPPDGKLLVAVNGAYGRRLVKIAEVLRIPATALLFPENEPVHPGTVGDAAASDPKVTHVAVCHCETTSGVLNPVLEIGRCVRAAGRSFFVDAMSSFGAIPIDIPGWGIDYLVSSANKCIEGVPGFAFVIARIGRLTATRGYARSFALDLLDQYEFMEQTGQFRFTPPTHVLAAFDQALVELEAEGGVAAREKRYAANQRVLVNGMKALGFRPYLADQDQGPIITSFLYPEHPRFYFDGFYRRVKEEGFVIYPGKVGSANCFRIGSIGRLFPGDMRALLDAVHRTLTEMGIAVPL